jgi:hypothetical protein
MASQKRFQIRATGERCIDLENDFIRLRPWKRHLFARELSRAE